MQERTEQPTGAKIPEAAVAVAQAPPGVKPEAATAVLEDVHLPGPPPPLESGGPGETSIKAGTNQSGYRVVMNCRVESKKAD
ncbi:MAG: hypothetical protein ACE5IK_00090 [Acidobacteriota bacterium]